MLRRGLGLRLRGEFPHVDLATYDQGYLWRNLEPFLVDHTSSESLPVGRERQAGVRLGAEVTRLGVGRLQGVRWLGGLPHVDLAALLAADSGGRMRAVVGDRDGQDAATEFDAAG